MWPQGRAHWHHLANMIELVLPSADPSPQPKQQIDQFSRFCTAHGRICLYFTMGDPFPQNCPFSWGIRIPIYFMIAWGRPSPQSKLHQDRFNRWPQSVPILHNGRPFPPKLPLPMGDLDHCVRHDSLEPSQSTDQTASLSVQPFLQRWPQSVPIFYHVTPLSTLKLPQVPIGT